MIKLLFRFVFICQSIIHGCLFYFSCFFETYKYIFNKNIVYLKKYLVIYFYSKIVIDFLTKSILG